MTLQNWRVKSLFVLKMAVFGFFNLFGIFFMRCYKCLKWKPPQWSRRYECQEIWHKSLNRRSGRLFAFVKQALDKDPMRPHLVIFFCIYQKSIVQLCPTTMRNMLRFFTFFPSLYHRHSSPHTLSTGTAHSHHWDHKLALLGFHARTIRTTHSHH